MIQYEWTLEEIKEGEIIDSSFSDTLNFDKEDLEGNDLGLVMNEGNEKEGLTNRLWAYVKNNSLPDYFSNEMGEETKYKVPAKFHKELKKYL
jgi:hypothetical protein